MGTGASRDGVRVYQLLGCIRLTWASCPSPNVLALNFGSTLVESMVFLGLFMAIACLLLYYFWVATDRCEPQDANEGFASFAAPRSTWGVIIVTFILSVLYLPLSTIAAHALVWSDDFWVVVSLPMSTLLHPRPHCGL